MGKNVLLSTLGQSPKTITQMYQALKFKNIEIAEIHVIITKGSSKVLEKYRPENVLWKEHLCEIPDVRNKEYAQQIGDKIFHTLKSLKEREDVHRVFLDITGGRKEMSGYLMTRPHWYRKRAGGRSIA